MHTEGTQQTNVPKTDKTLGLKKKKKRHDSEQTHKYQHFHCG